MQTNTAKTDFTSAQIESCTLLLKEEYKTLKGYKDLTGQPAKSWQDAAKFELAALQNATAEADPEAVETFADMPLKLAESLKSYASTVQAFKDGTVNRETVNDSLQSGILRLQDSGNKDFSLIQSILWLMYTSKGWRHDFDAAKKYLEATTPFIVRVQKKDVVATDATAQEAIGTAGDSGGKKELVVLLKRKKGYMWRKRPPAYWDSLRSFKQNGKDNRKFNDPEADAKKAASSIEKALDKSSEAALDASKRVELAANLLMSEEKTEGLASMLNAIQLNFEAVQALKSQAKDALASEAPEVNQLKKILSELVQYF